MYTKKRDSRVYSDRAEYLKRAVAERRRFLKKRAIELMGSACMVCGYDKHQGVLEFHHVESTTKTFGISSGGFSRSWSTIYAEMQKCILVCANCHREVELGLIDKLVAQEMLTKFWSQNLQKLGQK